MMACGEAEWGKWWKFQETKGNGKSCRKPWSFGITLARTQNALVSEHVSSIATMWWKLQWERTKCERATDLRTTFVWAFDVHGIAMLMYTWFNFILKCQPNKYKYWVLCVSIWQYDKSIAAEHRSRLESKRPYSKAMVCALDEQLSGANWAQIYAVIETSHPGYICSMHRTGSNMPTASP